MLNYYRDDLVPQWAYWVRAKSLYFYTPDGQNGTWYKTMAEIIDNHGPVGAIRFIDTLEI